MNKIKDSQPVVIEDTSETREIYLERDGLDETLRDDLRKADVLFLPKINFRQNLPFCFPEKTSDLFQSMKQQAKNDNLTIDLAVSDNEYREIELHDDWIRIVDFMVSDFAFPFLISYLASWFYDVTKSRPKAKGKISIIVEKNGRNKKITYEGDISNFAKTMKDIEKSL